MWREVFRRQTAFNREVIRVLGALVQGRPPAALPRTDDYPAWLAENEPAQFADSRRALATLRHRPLISVLVPAYRTPPEMLRACIESVQAQW